MKKLLSILLILFLGGCGYSPVFNNSGDKNFQIIVEKLNGDKKVNNLLKRKLKKYNAENNEKIIKVNVNSSFKKKVLAKDKTGRASDLELSTTINFNVEYNNKKQSYNFTEKLNIKRLSDFSEQNNYENKVKENFVNIILNQFILKLKML